MRWVVIFILLISVILVGSPAGVNYLEEREKNVPQPLEMLANFSQAATAHMAYMGNKLTPEPVQVFMTDVRAGLSEWLAFDNLQDSAQTQNFAWQQVGKTNCSVSLGMQQCPGAVRGSPCDKEQKKRKCGTYPKACDTRAVDGSTQYSYTVFSCLPESANKTTDDADNATRDNAAEQEN